MPDWSAPSLGCIGFPVVAPDFTRRAPCPSIFRTPTPPRPSQSLILPRPTSPLRCAPNDSPSKIFMIPPPSEQTAPIAAVPVPTEKSGKTADFRDNPYLRKMRVAGDIAVQKIDLGTTQATDFSAKLSYDKLHLSFPVTMKTMGGTLSSNTEWERVDRRFRRADKALRLPTSTPIKWCPAIRASTRTSWPEPWAPTWIWLIAD